MLNLGMGEVVLVLLVAFLIVGPKDLPKVARWLARQVKKARQFIREIKQETGWDELTREFRDTADDLKSAAKDVDVSADFKDAFSEAQKGINDAKKSVRSVEKDIKDGIHGSEAK